MKKKNGNAYRMGLELVTFKCGSNCKIVKQNKKAMKEVLLYVKRVFVLQYVPALWMKNYLINWKPSFTQTN